MLFEYQARCPRNVWGGIFIEKDLRLVQLALDRPAPLHGCTTCGALLTNVGWLFLSCSSLFRFRARYIREPQTI
jgi:hypothetical protein